MTHQCTGSVVVQKGDKNLCTKLSRIFGFKRRGASMFGGRKLYNHEIHSVLLSLNCNRISSQVDVNFRGHITHENDEKFILYMYMNQQDAQNSSELYFIFH